MSPFCFFSTLDTASRIKYRILVGSFSWSFNKCGLSSNFKKTSFITSSVRRNFFKKSLYILAFILFLYDLKFVDETKHKQFTGVSNKKLLTNLKYLDSVAHPVYIRVPLIPGLTDTEDNIHAIGSHVSSLSTINHIDILPYNRFGEEKYHRLNREFKLGERGHIRTQSDNMLNKIKNTLESYNLSVKIGG